MKFSDGYWVSRPGLRVDHPRHLTELRAAGNKLIGYAPIRPTVNRGSELDVPEFTVTVEPVAAGVIRVLLERHRGYTNPGPHFDLGLPEGPFGSVRVEGAEGWVEAGPLTAHIHGALDYGIDFFFDGRPITRSLSVGTSAVTRTDNTLPAYDPPAERYIAEQLTLDVGETVYGLGERFGPAVKNGQTVDIWNADGGTATEQAYKNVPFYLTSAGYEQ